MTPLTNGLQSFCAWLTNDESESAKLPDSQVSDIAWNRLAMFVMFHLACVAVFWVGVSRSAVVLAVAAYLLRMFFITAFYHRYFSHRAFKASRPVQFMMGLLGCTAGQRGPIWWAAHHRQHHQMSDTPHDPHSPAHKGFWFAHTLWFMTKGAFYTPARYVRDLRRFPELRWLERFDWVVFIAFGALCYGLGEWLPQSYGASGPQFLVWGFFISTVVLYHATYTINSLAHRFGSRRFETGDHSRNNLWLALLTLGEGWHNNHHRYPVSAKQGFVWWEIDISYWMLRLLSSLSVISDLKPVPARVLADRRIPVGKTP